MAQVSTDRRFGVISSSAIKVPVKAATTANITLSGEQTIDGISCVTDDRVLVQNQTTASENGIYTVDTGSWERAVDFNGTYDVVEGTIIPVNRGTVYGIRGRRITNTGTITIGTTSLTFGDTLYSSSSCIEFVQSGTAPIATTVQAYLRSLKIILGWIPTASWAGILAGTNTDDLSSYVDNAVTDAAGAAIYWPAGTYYCNVLDLPSNTHFYGDGEATIIRPFTTTAKGALGCASGSSSAFITGLTLRDLKFLGIGTFSEQAHLVILSGVKRARIEDCYFENFRGDGLILASSHNAATEEHNVDVTVRGCVFDGVDNDTRNGMTVIDVDGLDVDDCKFRNCAKSDMPGSLDLEPDQSYSVIKNVRVHHSRFYNTDGNRGHVILGTDATVNIENITIDHNHFEDVPANSAAVLLNTSTSAPATPLRIVIEANTMDVSGSRGAYKRDGAGGGITIRGNVIS